jgi:hypothetical protein
MPTLTSAENYLLTEFPNSAVNVPVLNAQIAAASLSVPLISTQLTGASVLLTFTGELSAGDITALNAVVAAHTGVPFGSTLVQSSDLTDTTTSSTSYVSKLVLNAGPLPAGTYLGSFACEHYLDTLVASTGSEAQLLYNTGVLYEDTWNQAYPHLFGSAIPFTVIDGAMVTLELKYKALGAVTVHCRRARLGIVMQ